MALGFGYKSFLGIGKETEYGEAVTRTVFLLLKTGGDGINIEEEHLIPDVPYGNFTNINDLKQGKIVVTGDITHYMRYQGSEFLFELILGSVVSTEQTTITIDATNNKLNFNIGAEELIATIGSASYAIGTAHTQAGTLCKAIYDAIVAAEAVGTYTVSYSRTTKKFTITRSAGTFQILWKTGANGADGTDTHIGTTIGYSDSADDTGALTYTSDNTIKFAMSHAFTIADSLPIGLTLEINKDVTSFIFKGVKLNTMKIDIKNSGFIEIANGIISKEVVKDTASNESLVTEDLIVFTQGVVSYNENAINVIGISININRNLTERRFVGSRYTAEPQISNKIEVTGTFTAEFDSTTLYDDFRSATARALSVVCTGSLIAGSVYKKLTLTLANIVLTGQMPKVDNAGPIKIECPFKAYATAGGAIREISATIINELASV